MTPRIPSEPRPASSSWKFPHSCMVSEPHPSFVFLPHRDFSPGDHHENIVGSSQAENLSAVRDTLTTPSVTPNVSPASLTKFIGTPAELGYAVLSRAGVCSSSAKHDSRESVGVSAEGSGSLTCWRFAFRESDLSTPRHVGASARHSRAKADRAKWPAISACWRSLCVSVLSHHAQNAQQVAFPGFQL